MVVTATRMPGPQIKYQVESGPIDLHQLVNLLIDAGAKVGDDVRVSPDYKFIGYLLPDLLRGGELRLVTNNESCIISDGVSIRIVAGVVHGDGPRPDPIKFHRIENII
jgi:hypothetical protein